MLKKVLKPGIGVFVAALITAQFIQPERGNHPVDPSVSFEAIAKPPREVAAVIERSCHDCHSHETAWPWYSRIAPVSWLVARDVKEGRAKLNFSQWNIYSPEMTRIKLGEICREVQKGEMPPPYYLPMHPQAKITPAEAAIVCSASTAQALSFPQSRDWWRD